MNWKDNRKTNTVHFGNLKVGDVFVWNDTVIYIKINHEDAFDICNNDIVVFPQTEYVEKREATLTLD